MGMSRKKETVNSKPVGLHGFFRCILNTIFAQTKMNFIMNEFEKVISSMDFIFFATGKHKIDVLSIFESKNAVLLDVRADEETSTVKLPLNHYLPVFEIPFCELPAKLSHLPSD